MNADVQTCISKSYLFFMDKGGQLGKMVKLKIRAVHLGLANYLVIYISKFLRLKSDNFILSYIKKRKGVLHLLYVLGIYFRNNKSLIDTSSI